MKLKTTEGVYIVSDRKYLEMVKPDGSILKFDTRLIVDSLLTFDEMVGKFADFEVNVFELLGMRNLSAFIGEMLVASMVKISKEFFVKNPHQDGYPDLLPMDKKGIELLRSLSNKMKDKAPFSPFMNGGIEIKATCGSVPTPLQCEKMGIEKPGIGDQRISMMRGYDWKAHHRQTNNLIGIVWDFINGIPCIVGIFYSHKIEEHDWGKIVHPKEGGGRTTSVSIMARSGIKKMHEGWVLVRKDERYTKFFDRYNDSQTLTQALNKLS